MSTFSSDFRWGAATASYQIEGGATEDGREPSIWDVMAHEPGRINDGSSGDVAVDSYHRYREDVALLKELRASTYRFSVCWPRVLHADGSVNRAGMDYYSALVDELLANGIRPWLTLYHWDLPASLEGGWLNRATAEKFVDYALKLHGVLGDRVHTWTTLNEPWCSAFLGYATGEHAPGRHVPGDAFVATHHLLLAHGLATRALRAADPAAELGITLNFTPTVAADPANPADVDVARRVDATHHRLFLDPLFRGEYPEDLIRDAGPLWPAALVRDGDLDTIHAPFDVLGINYYSSSVVRGGQPSDAPTPHILAHDAIPVPRDLPTTEMGWEVDPPALTALLLRLQREYTGPAGVAMVITENGAAYPDTVVRDGRVVDPDRIEYLRTHLDACAAAVAGGADLRGYLLWSLIDNFEWAQGYSKKFGIASVDADLNRLPKASFDWYRGVIARHGTSV